MNAESVTPAANRTFSFTPKEVCLYLTSRCKRTGSKQTFWVIQKKSTGKEVTERSVEHGVEYTVVVVKSMLLTDAGSSESLCPYR